MLNLFSYISKNHKIHYSIENKKTHINHHQNLKDIRVLCQENQSQNN